MTTFMKVKLEILDEQRNNDKYKVTKHIIRKKRNIISKSEQKLTYWICNNNILTYLGRILSKIMSISHICISFNKNDNINKNEAQEVR